MGLHARWLSRGRPNLSVGGYVRSCQVAGEEGILVGEMGDRNRGCRR